MSTFKVVFVGDDSSYKSSLLTSIHEKRLINCFNVRSCPKFKNEYLINNRNSKIEFIDIHESYINQKLKAQIYKKAHLIVIAFNKDPQSHFSQEIIENYWSECRPECNCPAVLCGISTVPPNINIPKKEISKVAKNINAAYTEVDLRNYESIQFFVKFLIDQLKWFDIVGEAFMYGIKYICFPDETCIAVESDNSDHTTIPFSIYYSHKEYIVKGIGYMRDKYHNEKDNSNKFENIGFDFPSDSQVEYIGNIDASKVQILEIPPSMQMIHSNFFKNPLYDKKITFHPSIPLGNQILQGTMTDLSNMIIFRNDLMVYAQIDDKTKLEIPQGVAVIGDYSCCQPESNFENINSKYGYILNIPSSVKRFGKYSFYCSDVMTIVFPVSTIVYKFCDSSFAKSKLTNIKIPSSTMKISKYSFKDCLRLKSVEFAIDSVLELIGSCAFQNTGITEVRIPQSCKLIGDHCFEDCVELEYIEIPANSYLDFIGNCAFKRTKIQRIEIPKNCQSIGDECFFQSKLKTIEFANYNLLYKIGIDAFSHTDLERIKFPYCLTQISFNCIRGCDDLKCVEIEEGFEGEFLIDDLIYVNKLKYIEMPRVFEHVSMLGNFDISRCYLNLSGNQCLARNGPFIYDKKTKELLNVNEAIYLELGVPTLIPNDFVDFEKNKDLMKKLENERIQIDKLHEMIFIDLECFPYSMRELILPPKCAHVRLSSESCLKTLIISNTEEATVIFEKARDIELDIVCHSSTKLNMVPENKYCRIERRNSIDYPQKSKNELFIEYMRKLDFSQAEINYLLLK